MSNQPSDDDQNADLASLLEQTRHIATEWLRNRSRRPVAPAAIAIPAISLPEQGNPASEAVPAFLDWADSGLANGAGPGYFGFVTGGVVPAAMAGDWLASAVDQNAATSVTSPAAAATEAVVIRWMLSLLGLPETWGGVMSDGATMSNLIGLAAGRQAVGEALGFDPTVDGLSGQPLIRVVTSTEVHSGAIKALGTLGLGRGVLTKLPAINGALDIDALRGYLESHSGPTIIIANAGEVNTGQFDDIAAIVRLRDELSPQSWIHVDAAFGAFAGASSNSRHLLAGIEGVDSVAADGHKWLNVPYDAGFVFFRDPSAAQRAFAISSAYQTRADGFDADTMTVEFSRRFRALPAWCALYSLGREGYRAIVDQCLANAKLLMDLVENADGVELVNREGQLRAPFCIAAFRITHADWSVEETDRANRHAVELINGRGTSYVSGTNWQGDAAIRAAFVNWQTRETHVRQLFADVLAARATIVNRD